MADPQIEELKDKIQELESELEQKETLIAKYHREMVKANERLESMMLTLSQELKIASQIQRALSPTEIPNIPGFEFSTKFVPGMKSGGDYFDIFELEDKMRFGIILASSSGYAMSALFLSVLIKLSGQIEARRGLEPNKVVGLLASELLPHIQNKDQASVFYGIVDRRSFELKYCSVGNIAAFLQNAGQDNSVVLEPSAAPLSRDFSATPLTHSLSLGPRDRILLCTEGCLEAINSKNEIFGKDRVGRCLSRAPRGSVHDLRNEILFQLEQFSGKSEPLRDQTVLAFEVKDRVIKLAKKGSL